MYTVSTMSISKEVSTRQELHGSLFCDRQENGNTSVRRCVSWFYLKAGGALSSRSLFKEEKRPWIALACFSAASQGYFRWGDKAGRGSGVTFHRDRRAEGIAHPWNRQHIAGAAWVG